MKNTVLVHYHSPKGRYFDYSLWRWVDFHEGEDCPFLSFDHFGLVGTIELDFPYFLDHVYVIVKNQDWSLKTRDFKVQLRQGLAVTEVWIVEGDDRLYYSYQAAITSHHYRYRNARAFDMALNHKRFDKLWGFQDWLGAKHSATKTDFRLWAPTAKAVDLICYQSASDDAEVAEIVPMQRGEMAEPCLHKNNTHGVWFTSLMGDYAGRAYSYRLTFEGGVKKVSRDPYSIATTADGRRSVILSKDERTPEGFTVKHGDDAFWRLENPNQAVVTEMHIRDFSMSETSGVAPEKRGKFVGAYQKGTTNGFGDKTTFDYLKELGISHVQLQPVFGHHQTLDEAGNYAYNWGYDPENYNAPDPSFSSDPKSPKQGILELKELIQAYHDAGIGVIMDVVYNHTFSSDDSAFQLTVPDYYYRMNADGTFQNGSGCGNETASEKEMYRKYMIDSLLYWVQEYNIDGFRFDLMGLHDVETMRQIRAALDEIDPRLIIYGEGWDMGTGLAPEQKAKKENAYQLPNIGFFNDNVRDAIKGGEVYGQLKQGFVSGEASEGILAKGMLASDELGSYLSPNQVLNYVEAHDNYNLNDLLAELHPDDDWQTHVGRVEVASALGILMQGMSFIQLGQEFLRSKLYPTGKNDTLTQEDKERAMNSYNSPDEVNQVDWNKVTYNHATMAFIKQLIHLKRHAPAFSYQSFEELRKHVYVQSAKSNSHLLVVDLEGKRSYRLIFNLLEENLENLMTDLSDYAIIVSNMKRLQKGTKHLSMLSALVFEITR